ncbi:3-phytase B [Wickerhamomyces ciferrii]|uniref:acid phosphatase n=1 Tax=Wickerhamomyces ciferrii (strain ATCC 14091 / BCRC 22168 / CBS 111 / JCM 3599 / NBRC 0793 / NRRL Y-1031 F-60-10) TaxID=1206466 RepID=K0KM53_WICCF|nr:3-phytase B [Wickerhamomyces ciferrii]CCH42203.1 3-phytase B [Wickerhamomyces ciferrii]
MQLSSAILSTLALSISAIEALPIGEQQYSLKPYSQNALDQYNVLRFIGAASPYVQNPGYGIQRDAPYQCKVTQANLISRHGERYPTTDLGKEIIENIIELNVKEIKGPLSFLKDYQFKGLDKDEFENETSKGPYSGLLDQYRHGTLFREQYDDLTFIDDIKFFTASQERVAVSAKQFAKGFLGEAYNESLVVYLEEHDPKLGANTLTPVNSCKYYDIDSNQDKIDQLSTSFLNKTADRLNGQNEGLNISSKIVKSLLDYCGFELNVQGTTQICDIFNNDEYLAYSYIYDLTYFYQYGTANNLSTTVGSTYVDALIRLIKDDSKKLTLSFAHDTDIYHIVALLGLFETKDLPTDHQSFNHLWKISNIVPMGARLITERLECEGYDEPFVRFVHNDAVLPIEGHSEGPGFSISLSDFENFINDRMDGKNFAKDCDIEDGAPDKLTFFWDN